MAAQSGIGIKLSLLDSKLRIDGVMDRGPAFSAGIRAGWYGTAGFCDEQRAPCVAAIAFSQPFFCCGHCLFSGISSQSTGLMSPTAPPARCSRCCSALQGAPPLHLQPPSFEPNSCVNHQPCRLSDGN
jgi:hypothetical protein